ncbi:ABC transporter ATP-binding protein [Pontivivens insulae]|uniref:Arginine transport ATP-binding protein ArtM n=1 Tax=Pontivivens insulae TaxID=1639689 RepID=A0A2R8AD64_9RHOB|nr:ATP-binding cassette domain-containing protein [Pontivivens insulae]RED14097.1 tungstate transport system ATP-binding protein [Pontivivens insulae]SPF30171.1 Arginine transport ATP-binding protein ArtM [Pontivivens insulae]
MADPLPFRPPAAAPVMPDRPAVRIEDLRLTRRWRKVIDGISADLGTPGCTAIMGPNGAGKSLLLRTIAGLEKPQGGTITFAWPPTPEKRRVALVFQRPVLLRRTALANLVHALRQFGVPRAARTDQAMALLERADLAHAAKTPARALSGGEQQRLALVRALGQAPDLLLLDEPSASLDPRATAALERLIRQAIHDGVRVLLITHDRGQARRLANRVVFLHAGRVTEDTPSDRFFDVAQSPQARAYLNGDLLL